MIQNGGKGMFVIKQSSKQPIFEQIVEQVIHFISINVLKPEDKLPSVRTLAQDLKVNPNTIVKAYSELENKGIIISSYKRGYFVANKDVKDEWKQREIEELKGKLKKVKELKVSKKDVVEIVNEIYQEGE
ncbi:MAG: GntR family transcriptional regulator [Erysipelotrichia bacterium]|nr:GntR family transcriptional regulator [Erysipelotrichia bacterium]NCC54071.1 GntR family transcriptional regulator [Erysipelotrichia bacterium]